MFGFVINKLKNRKWLNLCLLMGVALFIALFVCHAMFEKVREIRYSTDFLRIMPHSRMRSSTDEPRGNICGGRLS